MTHLEMKRFKDWLYAENAKRLGEGQAIIESFYPYDFLKGGRPLATPSKTQGKGVSTATPSDFESFVFLKTTESDIYNIVHDRWNLDFRIRLMHYLDPAGKHAVVPDKMMDDFFEACLKYRG